MILPEDELGEGLFQEDYGDGSEGWEGFDESEAASSTPAPSIPLAEAVKADEGDAQKQGSLKDLAEAKRIFSKKSTHYPNAAQV